MAVSQLEFEAIQTKTAVKNLSSMNEFRVADCVV